MPETSPPLCNGFRQHFATSSRRGLSPPPPPPPRLPKRTTTRDADMNCRFAKSIVYFMNFKVGSNSTAQAGNNWLLYITPQKLSKQSDDHQTGRRGRAHGKGFRIVCLGAGRINAGFFSGNSPRRNNLLRMRRLYMYWLLCLSVEFW